MERIIRSVLFYKVGETAGASLPPRSRFASRRLPAFPLLYIFLLLLLVSAAYGRGHDKKKNEDYGQGFSTEISASESDVLEAVKAVVNDGMIQGSKEYNNDRYIEKADYADSSSLFPAWDGPGKVFYKVRKNVLAPTNFKESNDEGTLAVRYVVQSKDANRTILRIDAVFVEDFRRVAHASDGSVEGAEYRDVQDRVDAIQLDRKQTLEAAKHRDEEIAKKAMEQQKKLEEAAALAAAEGSSDNLDQHVQNLRHQLERVIKAPGGELKSAPFHTATTLKSLPAGSDVVILIVTSYWYGVETEDGAHGWIHHSQLEPLQ
jgi:hypothetical protein